MFGVEFVLDGDVDFAQDGRSYHVLPGQVYLLRRDVAHVYRTGPSGRLHKYYIAIEGPLLEPLLLATGLDTCDHVVPESRATIEELFARIRDLMQHKPAGFTLELSTCAYQLLVELSRSISRRYPEPIRAAVEFIDRNLTRTLMTEDICAVAGLSQTHFNRLFRQHLGVSPKQFFIRHKMAWAQRLLTTSHFSVKEVSATLGYDDPLYFSSQFKRHAGVSPKHYRSGHGASGGADTTQARGTLSGA